MKSDKLAAPSRPRFYAKIAVFCCFLILGTVSGRADDTSGKFTIYMGGNPIASETYALKKADGRIELSGTGSATMGTMKISIDRFIIVTDDKFIPQSAEAKAQLGQLKMLDSITFADGKASNQIDTGQGPKPKVDDVHPDTLVVNANLPLFAWSILAQRVKLDGTDPQTFHAYIIGQAEVPVTVTSKGKEPVEFANKKADLTHMTMSFPPGPSSQPIEVEFWLDDARQIVKIVVPAQNVEAYQEGYERKAPPPKPVEKP